MLRGSLDDFTLSDIFRLLSFTKKTGKLEVVRGAGDGKVFFRDGEVYFAQSSIKREPLGQKLVRAGALTESALMKALDLNAETGERVGEVLLREGAITEEQLITGVRGQIEDAVFDLLRWDVGDYEFETHERFVAEIPISVSVENLIMEASRRLDELQMMQKKIPSADVVVVVAPVPPEGAREINITPDEWRLLVIIDGSRTVGQICEAANLDEFTGTRTLYGLISSGLVDVISLGPTAEPSPVARPPLAVTDLPPVPEEVGAGAMGAAPTHPDEVPVADTDFGFEPEDGDRNWHDDLEVDLNTGAVDTTVSYGATAANETELEYEPRHQADANGPPGDSWPETDALGHPGSDPALRDLPGGGRANEGFPPDVAAATEPEGPSQPEEPPPPRAPEPPLEESRAGEDTFLSDILNVSEVTLEEAERPETQDGAIAETSGAADDGDGSGPASPTRVDRAAVVRELAGLFSDKEMQPRRVRSSPGAGDSGVEAEGAAPAKRRVEDDEEISKGLIGRFIDGVKGM